MEAKKDSSIKTAIVQATINLRPAEAIDLAYNRELNIGTEYYVLNGDGITLSGKHTITLGTDKEELNLFYKQNRIYVPVSCLDAPILLSSSIHWTRDLKSA